MKFDIELYVRENGECPVEVFFRIKLNVKMKAKIYGLIDVLEEYGNQQMVTPKRQIKHRTVSLS